MIIFINGAFGVGKTTVAERLVARLPDSLLFDAELAGSFLRRVVPEEALTGDFQDLPMWRELAVMTARLLRRDYGRTLIMPMTIWHRPYFAEVVGGLRAAEPDFHHFTLTATRETLEARIRASNEAMAWRLDHVERCLDAFASPAFAVQVPTDGRTLDEIVEAILASLPPGTEVRRGT